MSSGKRIFIVKHDDEYHVSFIDSTTIEQLLAWAYRMFGVSGKFYVKGEEVDIMSTISDLGDFSVIEYGEVKSRKSKK